MRVFGFVIDCFAFVFWWILLREVGSDCLNLDNVHYCFQGEKMCFIMNESNVLHSSFLERMNTLLANGEIPGLFEGDELKTLMTQCKDGAKHKGLAFDSQEELHKWFTQQVKVYCTATLAFESCIRFCNSLVIFYVIFKMHSLNIILILISSLRKNIICCH